MHSENGRM